jgi:hypothetical protein
MLSQSSVACPKRFAGSSILCGLLVLLVQSIGGALPAASVTWSPITDPNVTGYKVYYGTASHNYSNVIVEGNSTNATLTGLVSGTTYFIAATTYDAAGNESPFSNEAVYTVPAGISTLTVPTQAGGQFGFTVSGVSGTQYVVQASTNLVNWVSLQTNTAPFNFVDTGAGAFHRRFYRTMSL